MKKLLSVIALIMILCFTACDLSTDFSKSPYLIYSGSNSQMKVVWQMNNTADCKISWGYAEDHYDLGSATTAENSSILNEHLHSFTIAGLTPGTKYYYQVTATGVDSVRKGSFYTAPASDATKVNFIAWGDSRSGADNLNNVTSPAVLQLINADESYRTFMLYPGDITDDGDIESYWNDQFFGLANVSTIIANVPLVSSWGNHESFGLLFKKYFPYPYVDGLYWSFDYGPAHVAVVDQNSDYSTGSKQHKWLENDLASSDKKWKFILLHKPGWSAYSTNILEGHPNEAAVQNYIQPLCEAYKVAILFAAHNHYYARAEVNGIVHITTAGAGAPFYDPDNSQPNLIITNKTMHYCKVQIDGNNLQLTAVKPDGAVIDSFALSK